ncbi:MAG: chromate resistance protein [Sporocytophaga sp.]|uniref:chromate resistance protein ChrB domain-containing protein n=1 Tax=Sporocytophaga sp. TaxID=2231183 RepID=UPI001B2C59D2|nr:chromate resistance protein ChrB domain-containing protein [Sporocytophaga sp.]MBO9701020.1 chromate resistance protein [Sporocytophaga sp.]
MKWITRERPKIDRIACPWLISRFIDDSPEFIFVPTNQVIEKARELDAIPYDIPGVEYTHEGDKCTFDYFLKKHEIQDNALFRLALIVRAADTDRYDLAPQASGLFAISAGLSYNFINDQEMLKQGMIIYDALYSWCKHVSEETHGWEFNKL